MHGIAGFALQPSCSCLHGVWLQSRSQHELFLVLESKTGPKEEAGWSVEVE